eukprot:TRINITY_DN84006_c0_g1_i1.p1 TRINITY_DN84006_c0_g1~~TRINITY_DN84006_c0_g1_i1.p1  ORF type:complete len:111 (-),score=11.49 TRINITY_DN84006_c0_g1_i1:35-367(-)
MARAGRRLTGLGLIALVTVCLSAAVTVFVSGPASACRPLRTALGRPFEGRLRRPAAQDEETFLGVDLKTGRIPAVYSYLQLGLVVIIVLSFFAPIFGVNITYKAFFGGAS